MGKMLFHIKIEKIHGEKFILDATFAFMECKICVKVYTLFSSQQMCVSMTRISSLYETPIIAISQKILFTRNSNRLHEM